MFYRFLKSKVAILKQELEVSQQENVKNLRTYESTCEQLKKNATQTDQVINENEALKIQIDKMQKANNVYEAMIKVKDNRKIYRRKIAIDFCVKNYIAFHTKAYHELR